MTCLVWISNLQRHHGGLTLGGGSHDLRPRRRRSHNFFLRRHDKLLLSLVLVYLLLATLQAAESTITPGKKNHSNSNQIKFIKKKLTESMSVNEIFFNLQKRINKTQLHQFNVVWMTESKYRKFWMVGPPKLKLKCFIMQ